MWLPGVPSVRQPPLSSQEKWEYSIFTGKLSYLDKALSPRNKTGAQSGCKLEPDARVSETAK
jgi:hypothetical protein